MGAGRLNAIVLFLFAGLVWGCSQKVEGPRPMPDGLEPDLVCQDQLETWLTMTGDGFSPAPVGSLTGDPRLSLPGITLRRTADIDGSALSGQPDIPLNEDPTDPAQTRVRWTSQREVSFLIDPSLGLERGLYDVEVVNPTAGRNTLTRALAAVPPLVLESARPTPICAAQYTNTITLTGDWLLRIGGVLPSVTIDGVTFTPTSATGCTDIVTPRGGVQRCTGLTVVVGVDELAVGAHLVHVTNPSPAHCQSTETIVLHVLPPPSIAAVAPQPVCVAQSDRALVLSGAGFLVIDAREPSVTIGGVPVRVDALTGCVGVDGLPGTRTCTGMEVTLAQGALEPGVHAVVVQNPVSAECVSEEAVTLAVVPPPSLAGIEPQPICTAQGANGLVLSGAGFLEIAGVLPSVQIGGLEVTSVSIDPADCAPVPGTSDSLSCTRLYLTLGQDALAPGLHAVVVTNPAPAGCESSEAVSLAVVSPPSLADIAPNPICLAQNDARVTLTGLGFLRLGQAVPSVQIGGLLASEVVPTPSSCSPVPGVADADSCTELTALLPQNSLAEGGAYLVTVTNPAPADCQSTEQIYLEVAPPPDIESVSPATICTGGGIFTITGTQLAGVYAYLVDSSGGEVHPSSITVNAEGTEAQVAFGAGLRPDTYDLHVTGAGGCHDMLTGAITVTLGPVAYYLDPPAVFSGVSVRAILYVSGMTGPPGSLSVAPAGGGAETTLPDVVWDPGAPNRIRATIPAGLDAGVYDIFARDVGGCDAFLARGLTVVSEVRLALLDPALEPRFGEQGQNTAALVLAKPDAALLPGEVNFQPTPRVYLSSAALSAAEPMRSVVFEASDHLSGVIPPLPAGTYDLVVVNPGEPPTVGFRPAAFEAVSVPPPVITSVSPTKIEQAAGQAITIDGQNFFDPHVTLECSDGSAPPAVIGTATATRLEVSVNASGVLHGAVCVVRVTNTLNLTFDEWSALSVTNPAGNLSPFKPNYQDEPDRISRLNTARRAPGLALGQATRKARFLYAIGGDDGTSGGAMTSVEAAGLGRFGEIGAWRLLQNGLPTARSLVTAQVLGRFIYLLGGAGADGVPTDEILRAEILDPLAAPGITNLDLRFAGSGAGLEAGSWTYAVAAVFDATDAANPGGEGLPGEPVTLYAPEVPDGVEVELTWDTLLGADGSTPAAAYLIYRTRTVNGIAADLRLLAVVAGTASPSHSFVDLNPAAFHDETKEPLRIGALGAWHLAGLLNTPRAAYGFVEVAEAACPGRWYLFGGATDLAAQSLTYEVLDTAGGVLGAPSQFTAAGTITARRELAVWAATNENSTASGLGACQFYFYAGPGVSGASTAESTVRVATFTGGAGGQLGDFAQAMTAPAPVGYTGYAAFWSGSFAYALGGQRGGNPSATVTDAAWSLGAEPSLSNWNDAASGLNQARYLFGSTRAGAFVYLVGGLDGAGSASNTCEYNVR
jgi:hypothetical protein